MKQVQFDELITEATRQVEAGAFLLTGGSEPNPMTIGWCQWGVIWGNPICAIFVRKSRHSYDLLHSGAFTVSVHAPGTMKKELAY